MAIFAGWELALLHALGAPTTTENVAFLHAWQRAEGGTARFNPLNTTQSYGGATNYNSVGVKNYPSATAGTSATTSTLLNGRYPTVVAALRSGQPVAYANSHPSIYSELRTWGTGGGFIGNVSPSARLTTAVEKALDTFDKIIAALRGKKISKAKATTAAEALLAAGKKPSPDQMSALVAAGVATSSVQSSLPGYHTVVGAKNAVSGAFSGMEDAWNWISNPTNILRIGEVMAGGLMLGIGLLMLARTTSQTETVQSVGGAVSMAKAAVT